MQQLSLIPAEKPVHGGDHKLGQRKTLRPLACDRPIHLILKAREAFQADIGAAVLENARRIAEKFRIRIFDHAVGHDHVHLVLKIPHRREYVKFIRALTGVLARKFGKGFWKELPYTRVASWGRDYSNLSRYLEQNRLEAGGEMPYKLRFWKMDNFGSP